MAMPEEKKYDVHVGLNASEPRVRKLKPLFKINFDIFNQAGIRIIQTFERGWFKFIESHVKFSINYHKH